MSYKFTRPRTRTAINLSSAVRNSAVTLCSDNDRGDRGWAAVIGLTSAWVFRQIHSYERVLIYVGLKPTWKGIA